MKKLILISSFVLIISASRAQWTDSGTTMTTFDKIGIGLLHPAQGFDLQVQGAADFKDRISFNNGGAGKISWGSGAGGPGAFFGINAGVNSTLSLGSNNTWDQLVIRPDGKVGIGTTTPEEKVHINGAMIIAENPQNRKFIFKPSTGFMQLTYDDGNNGWEWSKGITIREGGNVGIGTILPSLPLHVKGSILTENGQSHESTIRNEGLYLLADRAFGLELHNINSRWGLALFARNDSDIRLGHYSSTASGQGNMDVKMTIVNTGNIGIGTSSPTEKLHISGSGLVRSIVESSDNHAYYVVEGAPGKGSFVDYYRKGDGRIWHTGLRNSNNNFEFRLNDQSTVLALKENGNVGIGTITTGNHKLAVEGSIGAREIKVEASGWSDFVFEKDYNLPTLEEVEEHIAEKGHLPDIPSEAEVSENGINLGEMNAKLLQKIEELTLYLIEQNKEIEELKKEMEILKKK